MNRKKRKIFLIIFIIALIGLLIYLYLIRFFHWIPEEESGGTEKRYSIEYQGNTYICDMQEHLIWERVLHSESDKYTNICVGWGDFWRQSYYSNRKENPNYIYPYRGRRLIYFREDIDVFQEPLLLYDYSTDNHHDILLCLNDVVQNDSIEIAPELIKNCERTFIYFRMKNNPFVSLDSLIYKYNERYYVDLDLTDACNAYKDKYFPLSDELVKEIFGFYGVAFD